MSIQQKPVIHGRDHAYGGADPLGIAWEDVGDSGGGSGGDVTGLEWWRFATFTSTSYVTIGGGIGPCFSWASKVASYEGKGSVPGRRHRPDAVAPDPARRHWHLSSDGGLPPLRHRVS